MKPSSRLLKQAINSDAGHPNFVYDPHNPTNTKKYREDIDRIQHDLQILSQKIAEVRGDSPTAVSLLAPSSSSIEVSSGKKGGGDSGSPFVTGIRTLAESERTRAVAGGVDIKDQKISALESLLEKIGDYDRLVLARTVPAETNSNGQPQRRKSFGTDLNVLPTHLRVIDRLMDLYSSSKRVTVLRQTVTPPPNNSTNQQDTPPTNNPNYIPLTQPKPAAAPDPALQKAVEELKSNLSKAQQKLELSESRRVEAENQFEFKSKDYETLQKKYESLQETQHQHDAELQKQKILYQQLLDSMKQFEGQSSNLQEKLEIEISQNQRLLNILMNKIQAIQKDNQSVLSFEQSHADDATSYHGMPEKYQIILQALDAAISERFSGYRSEVQLVLSLKDMIETEMNSLTVQKDLLSKDFQTLQDEHDALKTAYHSLSYESATSMSSTKQEKAEISKLQKEISGLQEIVRNQTETITRLERDKQIQSLSENSMKQYELYNKELEQKILTLEKEKNDLEFHQKTARLEVERYKDLTEKLKQKLKDSTSSSNQKNDFFDTFEEVMKEEMMTMKMAFETKLKLAREESDALQRKHQQEILRLQASSSPFSASKR